MAVKPSPLSNNKGIAILETLPMVVIFTMVLGYAIGMWGVVHTAIMNSMGARAYAFSTFNHRTDLSTLRDRGTTDRQYKSLGFRLHSIYTDERDYQSGDDHYATRRVISITDTLDSLESRDPPPPPSSIHNENVHGAGPINRISVNPVWVQTSYGICVTTVCGD